MSLLVQELFQQYLKGGIRNWKPGANLLSGRLFWTFFPVFKQIGVSTNDYQKNWDTERLLLLSWCFSRSSFSLQVFKRGFMRHFLKGFWLCRCLGRSPGFIVQIIYFFDNPLFKCHENVLHGSTFGNLWGFLFHPSKENLIVKLHLTKV